MRKLNESRWASLRDWAIITGLGGLFGVTLALKYMGMI
jgi:hypothetical protein